MLEKTQARELIGQELRATDGSKIGTIGQVYLDDHHDVPEWVTVKTGLFGTRQSFVPLAEADLTDDGVVVPYTKDRVKDAPNVDEDGRLDEAEERALYDHYHVAYTTEGSTFAAPGATGGVGGSAETVQPRGDAEDDGTGGSAVAAGTTDDAMTRSEQRLDVGTERVETGRARLRKWVEEENVQVEVPVTRVKARLVTEPVTDATRGDAMPGPALREGEHEVTLTEERPVVSKETVPVERVRLEKDVETGVRQVDETVGKERIDVDGDPEHRNRR